MAKEKNEIKCDSCQHGEEVRKAKRKEATDIAMKFCIHCTQNPALKMLHIKGEFDNWTAVIEDGKAKE